MRIRYAALVAALVVLAGCTSGHTDGGLGPDPNAGSSLLVHTHVRPGPHGTIFVEGAVPELRLLDASGRVRRPVQDHRTTAAFPGLAPGTYRLRAALRPCDGNCGLLDPPTLRCAATVRVDGAEVVQVRWRIGRSCRVSRT